MKNLPQTLLAGVAGAFAVEKPRQNRKLVILRKAMLGSLLLVACPAPAISQLVVERTIFFTATGTPSENCNALRSVLNSITGATFDTPFHVKVSGGVYDCGGGTLIIPSHVFVEGTRIHTVIVGNRSSEGIGVVDFASAINAGLRSVSVENIATGSTVTVFNSPFVVLENVAIYAAGIALRAIGSSNTRVRVSNSLLSSDATTAKTTHANHSIEFHSTQLDGSLDISSGEVKCGSSYNESFTPLDSACLPPP